MVLNTGFATTNSELAEFFESFIEQSSVPMEVFSLEGDCLYVNKAVEALFELNSKDLHGYNIFKDPQLAQQGIHHCFHRAARGESIKITAFPYDPQELAQVGRARWLEAHLFPVKNKMLKIENVGLILIDVTEKKELEFEIEHIKREKDILTLLRQRVKVMSDALPSFISYIDRQGEYQFVNQIYLQWFNTNYTGILGKHIKDILGDVGYNIAGDPIRKVLSGEQVQFSSFLSRNDGQTLPVLVTFCPDFNDAGDVQGFLSVGYPMPVSTN